MLACLNLYWRRLCLDAVFPSRTRVCEMHRHLYSRHDIVFRAVCIYHTYKNNSVLLVFIYIRGGSGARLGISGDIEKDEKDDQHE